MPAAVPTLAKAGLEVLVERGAGKNAGFPDAAYEEQGARLVRDRIQLFSSADVLPQVHGLGSNSEAGHADLELLRSGQVVLGLLNPLGVGFDPVPDGLPAPVSALGGHAGIILAPWHFRVSCVEGDELAEDCATMAAVAGSPNK